MTVKDQFGSRTILAIETSCDETSAAVLKGTQVLSNIVASQIEMHQKWGGVVPEAAARAHVEAIVPVVEEAYSVAQTNKIDAVAVTNRPGLVGALAVGTAAAKAIAIIKNIPIIGVHHLEGHLLSPWANSAPEQIITYPHLALIVSGGHTELVLIKSPSNYQICAETLDDAAGEAFDKGARLLGLGYPGGKAIQEAAQLGNPQAYDLPRALKKEAHKFSFSGLKTAMLRLVQTQGSNLHIPDAAASLQQAIVESLVPKCLTAIEEHEVTSFALVGGVSANVLLRETLRKECERNGIQFLVPEFEYCTDNAAMIGLAGQFRLESGESSTSALDVFPNADLPLPPHN